VLCVACTSTLQWETSIKHDQLPSERLWNAWLECDQAIRRVHQPYRAVFLRCGDKITQVRIAVETREQPFCVHALRWLWKMKDQWRSLARLLLPVPLFDQHVSQLYEVGDVSISETCIVFVPGHSQHCFGSALLTD